MLAVITFWWLLCGHALCDYPLQGDFLAKGKNHKAPNPGVPWWICLAAHALIHGGAVAVVTGSAILGVLEFSIHCLIDYGKCDGWYSFEIDQGFHVVCKIAWAIIFQTLK